MTGLAFDRAKLGLVVTALAGLALLIGLPMWLDLYALLQVTLYIVFAILTLSLGFVLGFGGILCLGQSAFFGIGAYAYAIAAINIGETTIPALLALLVPGLFAAALGYFIFYGRITDVYVGVITLTVSLILFSLVNSTAGPEYHIGTAALGGFNGIPNVPILNWPLQPDAMLDPQAIFYLAMGGLLVVYFGLRALLAMRFGRVVVAVRENERRAELLGYDVRLVKLVTFTLGAVIAGFAGLLFANWGAFVGPSVFGVMQSAQVLIWVMVGGTGTLLGPVAGSMLVLWLTNLLGGQQLLNTSLVLGAILLVFVLVIPSGLLPAVGQCGRLIETWLAERRSARSASLAEQRKEIRA